jgi:hypothetical protein
MRTKLAVVVSGLVLTALVTGCGDDDPEAGTETTTSSPHESPSESPTPATESPTPSPTPTEEAGTVIEMTIRGDQVEPNGKRIEVGVGEQVTLKIDADQAGELHVHSRPEQELEYGAGMTTVRLTIDAPGVVDVEDHHAGKVLVSLQVS